MSLLDLLFGKKKQTASVAKERLQIILAHERSTLNNDAGEEHPSWLPQLQSELMEVIAKYIKVDQDALKVHLERRDNLELLEINVTLPEKSE
ncbi:MAG: cell division topological specificity factor MinE [Burkholderiales bacterium]|nr:cell division topological specificity factor MinE [Burkholderiales bacterium]